jgi:hypothetical protein
MGTAKRPSRRPSRAEAPDCHPPPHSGQRVPLQENVERFAHPIREARRDADHAGRRQPGLLAGMPAHGDSSMFESIRAGTQCGGHKPRAMERAGRVRRRWIILTFPTLEMSRWGPRNPTIRRMRSCGSRRTPTHRAAREPARGVSVSGRQRLRELASHRANRRPIHRSRTRADGRKGEDCQEARASSRSRSLLRPAARQRRRHAASAVHPAPFSAAAGPRSTAVTATQDRFLTGALRPFAWRALETAGTGRRNVPPRRLCRSPC